MSKTSQSTYSFSTSAKTSGGGGFMSKTPLIGTSSPLSSSTSSSKSKKDKEPIIKNVDMTEDMQERALDLGMEAYEKFNTEKDRGAYIKKAFDVEFDTTWHVVVGKHFASFVTHESKCFIYFYIGPMAFLIWKSG
ncbi:dynein light chain 2, cytoplasmic [Strongylocentrotus purpuratus]|uniref:Dynein light chain n=1 Tax=Strongylocentrotus purpuratus TaxID=7668 RepID=A0A7M7RES0_STRPU|nr:dynein light chain 2, cytoplasmic [Strongylocentrotus purpuratus]|eukprot:XP_795424.1 PREDICTED: dynein light chain 2, cytoplasmic [Strongylocentrotus purpuratus]